MESGGSSRQMERPEKEKAKVKILGGIKFLKDCLIY